MQRLATNTLVQLKGEVSAPAYDYCALKPGIVHLGLGAFHRAHQAVFTDMAIAASGGDWGIIGVSMRSPAVSNQLQPQDCLYSVLAEDGTGHSLRVVGAIRDVLVAPREPLRVAAAIADPSIAIVTLTITEKAYCLADDGQSLDQQSPAVAQDLSDPLHPVSALGLLALGLHQRCQHNGAALTIISCDNLSSNSAVLRSVLRDYLQHCFPEVLPWLDGAVTFPCSMVDRITPAMDARQRAQQAKMLGLEDDGAVRTEPFSQWIIEDGFAATRPDWASAGVMMVDDIRPYEEIKLRLLNASHSAIAYCGLLAGLATVDQVMASAVTGKFVARLMRDELQPALAAPSDFDLDSYREQLLRRFSNPTLGHRCAQIAMDGSEKIRQRWLPTLQSPGQCPALVKALAIWCFYILRTELTIDDPRGDELRAMRRSGADRKGRLREVLACARISGATLAGFEHVHRDVAVHVEKLDSRGLSALLEE